MSGYTSTTSTAEWWCYLGEGNTSRPCQHYYFRASAGHEQKAKWCFFDSIFAVYIRTHWKPNALGLPFRSLREAFVVLTFLLQWAHPGPIDQQPAYNRVRRHRPPAVMYLVGLVQLDWLLHTYVDVRTIRTFKARPSPPSPATMHRPLGIPTKC